MKYMMRLLAIFSVVLQLICIPPSLIYASEISEEEQQETVAIVSVEHATESGVNYLSLNQDEYGAWGVSGDYITANIADILEYEISTGYENEKLSNILSLSVEYFYMKDIANCDDLSCYLLINEFQNEKDIECILNLQNPDGGFGLSEGYESDIIDTKLALKTLADLNETEAMTKAAVYIASLQNEDGGFSYQQGLTSNPELTAEIADILADCIMKKPSLSDTLSDTILGLNEYLEANAKPMNELSADDLSAVYQHFHTALFQLKTTGKYNVTPYYELQNEDGGVFDDTMATALFLELIVREQNIVIAKLDSISITNDKGYSVSSFNANENVNITIKSEYETEKAYMQLYINTPSGENIPLEGESRVWNTSNHEEGTYTVGWRKSCYRQL